MKKIIALLLTAILSIGCNAQEKKKEDDLEKSNEKEISEAPKGSWKVNKEFDEEGNLIRYDSIYTWSSGADLDNLASLDRNSTLQSLQSRFYSHFSGFGEEGFGNLFAEDSLFTKHFFNNDFFESEFGKDFMDLDKMHERMEAMNRKFLEHYRSKFKELEDENPDDGN